MNGGLFFQLLICAVCLAVYLVEIEKHHAISMRFLVSIFGVITIVAPTYVYCFLSENVTHDLATIGDIFYNFTWYRLPIKQQKLINFAIMRALKNYRMTGFGLVECSLRVFTSVRFKMKIERILINFAASFLGF